MRSELAARFAEPPRGEITLVLGPGGAPTPGRGRRRGARCVELVAAGVPRRQAADLVARLTGASPERPVPALLVTKL